MMERVILDGFGERCPVNLPGCPVCDAWSVYDDMKAKVDTAWNDAIEAAAQVANEYDHHEMEGAIRALRRPT